MAMTPCNTHQPLPELESDVAESFLEDVLLKVYEHFNDKDFADVTFKISNSTDLVPAHRLVLSSASTYFRDLFQSNKGSCDIIEITNIDSDTFDRLISFCYTGETAVSLANIDQMLKAAMILELNEAAADCAEFLIDHITDYTLKRAYALEREIQCAVLTQKIIEYEIGNFMDISQRSEFLNFNANKLQTIIESDHLAVQSEKDVFEAVKRWYEHDTSVRKQILPQLISCLRLTQFGAQFIVTNISPLPGCHILALETLAWRSHPLARSTLSLKYTKPRGESIMALNIWSLCKDYRFLVQYNKTENSWSKYFDIKTNVECFGAVFMDKTKIFVGGKRKGKAIDEVASWDFKTKKFSQLPQLNQPRYSHNVVTLNGKIYAIGGWMGYMPLRTVEVYSASEGWKPIANMITPRRKAGAVVFNGKIYVMGGSNSCVLKSVECYDPNTNFWTQCADMIEADEDIGATVHNNQIYIGDHGARYDPQRNEWTKISETLPRGCISFQNRLLAVGGNTTVMGNDFLVYDEQNDKWIHTKKRLPFVGIYYCFKVPQDLLI